MVDPTRQCRVEIEMTPTVIKKLSCVQLILFCPKCADTLDQEPLIEIALRSHKRLTRLSVLYECTADVAFSVTSLLARLAAIVVTRESYNVSYTAVAFLRATFWETVCRVFDKGGKLSGGEPGAESYGVTWNAGVGADPVGLIQSR